MSSRRKKEDSSQVSQPSEEVHVEAGGQGVVNIRLKDKFSVSIRKLFNIQFIQLADFSKTSHKCEIRQVSVKLA